MSISGQQKHLTLEIKPCDVLKIFSRFWSVEHQFLINFFSYKNMYTCIDILSCPIHRMDLIERSNRSLFVEKYLLQTRHRF